MPELKPCPFCGYEGVCVEDDDVYRWAQCQKCGGSGPLKRTTPSAVKGWNKRKEAKKKK